MRGFFAVKFGTAERAKVDCYSGIGVCAALFGLTVLLTAVVAKAIWQHYVAEIAFFENKNAIVKVRFINFGAIACDGITQTSVHFFFDFFKAVTGHSF
ncbi:hypothetical protein [Klebsiella aerogenes]|uniref:hypothetical protein n=1 Tax=Klebsiella aerogenes TaxID=548 RepID=UPI0013C3446C|nr:hypothetical protein [Klebsiella aerogenes]